VSLGLAGACSPEVPPPVVGSGGVPAGGGTGAGGASPGSGAAAAGGEATTGGSSSDGAGGAKASGGLSSSGGASAGSGGGSGGDAPRPLVEAEPGTSLLRIDLEERRQSFEGWGTSMCWWADRVGRWSPEGIDGVVDTLLDEVDGLGYSIFRYNIGGGENPAHDHMDQYKDIEGFQTSDGTFHWDADPYQRAVLTALLEYEPDLVLEAFSNSPPYWMTQSGCASGSASGGNNLKEDAYEPFAHYLTEVVKHFKDDAGIVFRTLEPLNEPNATWWKSNGGQEGCHFSPAAQERIILAVRDQLEEKGLSGTMISAADENSIDDALANLGSFGEETLSAIAQVNVHSYSGSQRKQLRALATELGKPLWQSESGPLGIDLANEVEAALFMGERIMADLTDLGAEAWLDWQVGDTHPNWGSIALDDQNESFQRRKRFYVQAAFSRFIRPGAQILGAPAPDIVIALNAGAPSLVLVLWTDAGAETRSFTLDLTELPTVGAAAQVHRTSRTEDLVALPDVPIEDFSLVVSSPPEALTTVVIPLP